MDFNDLCQKLGDSCYILLAINFFWGLYCVIIAWRRVRQLSFANPAKQTEFLNAAMEKLEAGRYDEAAALADNDTRALPQLTHVAVTNRKYGFEPLRQQITELMQRDVLAELEYRTSWIATVIKSGPLLGLFGTVLGMMAAFGRLGTGEEIKQHQIADDISIALVCTAMGLATAIPFNFFLAAINVRVRRLQDSLTFGLVRVLDHFKKKEAV